MPSTLLLEIGTEELPSSFVDAALEALPGLTTAKLAALRLEHGPVRALGTARRLAVIVDALADKQRDVDEEAMGPPEGAAYRDGKPTKAAEAFAAKLGVTPDELRIVDVAASGKQKAGRYVVGRRRENGREARELLAAALQELCGEIPFRKSMRWGAGEATIGRPVQWLVALLGADVVAMSFAGIAAGRTSRGHRFLSPGAIPLSHADAYVDALRERRVVVDREERALTMMKRVDEAAGRLGGTHDAEPTLVDENASLVEEPHVIVGSFDPMFLDLPPAVIRAVARGHQKYFCVARPDHPDELLPNYLAVVNTANDPAQIAKGNDRVMRARLADAKFFFEEDRRARIDERVEKLSGIVFHHRLGTVRDKVARLERLAGLVASALQVDPNDVGRAAHLCKFDLVSLMVGEFPELQGYMGGVYTRLAGEHEVVAKAVRDHYRPVGADGPVADDDVSACVALADRLDTLVGCFAVGLSPTGTADPFALRRNCIALLRTLLDRSRVHPGYAALPLGAMFGWAYAGYEGRKLDLAEDQAIDTLRAFATERLRGLIGAASSGAVADAVLAAGPVDYPVRAVARATVLFAAVSEGHSWLATARAVAKRLGGISKESRPVLHGTEAFEKEGDADLVAMISRVSACTNSLATDDDVRVALSEVANLAKHLDDFFVRTLVNDPNDARTPQRLELLSYGASCMLRIADFTRLA